MPTNTLCQVPFVDLKAQYACIKQEIDQAIAQVLDRNDFILGRDVTLLEAEFAAFCNVKYAIGVDSGTSALELALRAFGIGPGDEVITAANTFIATTLAISYTGATPVLVDCDPQTYNLDISLLEQAITERTKAIIPVHLYGQPADLDPILEIAGRHGLSILEDACQAHGARYKGERVGARGNAAAFSFYPGKNLGAYGDGGMITTNDPGIAEAVRMLRDYGQRGKYHHILKGYNRRLDTLQAAVLRVKLRYLDSWNEARRAHASRYNQLFLGSGVIAPTEVEYAESVYHLYVIRTQERDGLQSYLKEKGISTGIHYPIPIHLQPAYSDLGYGPASFPVSEELSNHILSLPMYAELDPEMVEYVADAVKAFVAERYAAPMRV